MSFQILQELILWTLVWLMNSLFEMYGDPAEEHMAGQTGALKAMLKGAHSA